MNIYTVVGETDYEGISHLGLSFTNEKDALECLAKCNKYNNTYYEPDRTNDWYANHPLSVSADGCYHYDSYDVIEHELIGGDV
tara:strand:+ start:34813 stop:35061 length:249 start_codon:yes stop_codon:yes gene_type:complete